jgi:hypothetical protein
MSTPPSIAARAPALLDGWAITICSAGVAAAVAARTMSTGITTMASRRAHDPGEQLDEIGAAVELAVYQRRGLGSVSELGQAQGQDVVRAAALGREAAAAVWIDGPRDLSRVHAPP